ncbi:hypothetical protein J6A31_09190 [bacterium]|nr:hypothetical protein [bacterium]
MDKATLFLVNGIDDYEGMLFAICTSEEKANTAVEMLSENGLEGCLEIEKSNLPLDAICIDEKLIHL